MFLFLIFLTLKFFRLLTTNRNFNVFIRAGPAALKTRSRAHYKGHRKPHPCRGCMGLMAFFLLTSTKKGIMVVLRPTRKRSWKMSNIMKGLMESIESACDNAAAENDWPSIMDGSVDFVQKMEAARLASERFEWMAEYLHFRAIAVAARDSGFVEKALYYEEQAGCLASAMRDEDFLTCKKIRTLIEADGGVTVHGMRQERLN